MTRCPWLISPSRWRRLAGRIRTPSLSWWPTHWLETGTARLGEEWWVRIRSLFPHLTSICAPHLWTLHSRSHGILSCFISASVTHDKDNSDQLSSPAAYFYWTTVCCVKNNHLCTSPASVWTSLLDCVLCESRIYPVNWLRWPVRVTCATASSPSTPATPTQACGGSTWCVSPALSARWCTSLRWNGEFPHAGNQVYLAYVYSLNA